MKTGRLRYALLFCLMILSIMILSSSVRGGKQPAAPTRMKYQITGLFAPEREPDLREVFDRIPDIKLMNIDFKNAEVTLEYDAAKLFGNVKPEQVIQRLDNLVKTNSYHTFGIKALRTLQRDKLQFVEIPVAGLDCKACCLAAYEIIFRLDGVEQATASFRDGRVTAWIDPTRVNRARLEAALRKREVKVKSP